jgi:hypothetical protein
MKDFNKQLLRKHNGQIIVRNNGSPVEEEMKNNSAHIKMRTDLPLESR